MQPDGIIGLVKKKSIIWALVHLYDISHHMFPNDKSIQQRTSIPYDKVQVWLKTCHKMSIHTSRCWIWSLENAFLCLEHFKVRSWRLLFELSIQYLRLWAAKPMWHCICLGCSGMVKAWILYLISDKSSGIRRGRIRNIYMGSEQPRETNDPWGQITGEDVVVSQSNTNHVLLAMNAMCCKNC